MQSSIQKLQSVMSTRIHRAALECRTIAYYVPMTLRYAAAFFLVVLLLLILGVIFGFLSFDASAPLDKQLTAAGALAVRWECDEDYCYWGGDTDEGPYYYIEEEEDESYYPGVDSGQELVEEEWWYGNEPPPYMGDEVDELYYSEGGQGSTVGDTLGLWGEWEAPRFESGGWYDEWVEDEYWFDEPQRTQNSQSPWYVNAFPGIGQVVQQIIPGQHKPAPRPIVAPRPQYPQPSCWISASPMSVEYGGSSTLSWSSFNATRASLTDFGNVSLSSSRLLHNIRSDRTYQITVSGAGGSGSCYTRITVRAQSATPSCVISAYPSSIHVGQSTNLAWGTANASSAYLSGVGSVGLQGGMYVTPNKTTTYTLTAVGAQGVTGSCAAQVGVLP